jgi:hypothetical protein
MPVSPKFIFDRFETLSSNRAGWEGVWDQINAVCYPSGPRQSTGNGNGGQRTEDVWRQPETARRAPRIYDTTGVIALDRATAGVESLITPQAQQWHELSFADPYTPTPSLDEEAWMDQVTEYLFKVRYNPRTGWLLSHQRALSSTLALGTGVYYIEEAYGTRDANEIQVPFHYCPVPLNEAYLAVSDYGEYDTCIRSFRLTAVQCLAKFGKKTPDKIRIAAETPATMDNTYQILHAVVPSEQIPGANPFFPFTSLYLDYDSRSLISEGGFFEFPFVIYTWSTPTSTGYSESPAMVALPEMKTLQLMSRDALLASQLGIRPPVGTAFELDRPVNLNPGAINPKMVDPNTGKPLVVPLLSPGDPRLFEATMELRRQAVRAALFSDLFNVLANKPNMSATEAMIRNQEKGELLGPAASRIQIGLSRCVNREMAILSRKGAFSADAIFAPPESMAGRVLDVTFTSPIDRARQMPEVTGMQQTLEFAGALANFAPDVLDQFDTDAMVTRARYLLGAPPLAQRKPEHVKGLRKERAKAAQVQQTAQQAAQAVETAGKLPDAAEGVAALGNMAGLAGAMPQLGGMPQTVQ